MKAFLFSDLHASYKQLKNLENFFAPPLPEGRLGGVGAVHPSEIELLVFAGDLVNMGEPVGYVEQFLNILAKINLPFFWVPGNNDFGRAYNKLNAKYRSLEGRIVEFPLSSPPLQGGVRGGTSNSIPFTGVGGSPASWAGQYAGESLIDKKLIGGSIFVSHVPPPGVLVMQKSDCPAPSSPRNFKDAPLVHICGHMHTRWGCGFLGSTKVINPGSLADGRYAILDLESLETKFQRF